MVVVLALGAALRASLIVIGVAVLIFGVLGVLGRSWPQRIVRNRRTAATVAVAGLLLACLGVALPHPSAGVADRSGAPPTSPAPAAPPAQRSETTREPAPAESSPALASPSAQPTAGPRPQGPATQRPRAEPEPGTALYALASLAVKGRAPKTGFDRDLFGSGWTDTDRNGCSTREDILRRDLRPVTVRAGTRGCDVVEGTLADPYTGTTVAFTTQGTNTSDDVQIDHVVSLSDAWQKGAQQWSSAKRIDFANHPLELLATDGPTNAAKSDGDTASWLPPDKSYRCSFVARQISIKARYRLWVTPAEKAAMARVLATCSGQQVITSAAAAQRKSPSATVREPAPGPGPEPQPDQSESPGDAPDDSVYYRNCDAVRAAGADPIHVGEPGYSRKLDRDGDGVGCER